VPKLSRGHLARAEGPVRESLLAEIATREECPFRWKATSTCGGPSCTSEPRRDLWFTPPGSGSRGVAALWVGCLAMTRSDEAVLFDLHDTLVHLVPSTEEAMATVLGAPVEDYRSAWRTIDERIEKGEWAPADRLAQVVAER
jgi:hypothetical protein